MYLLCYIQFISVDTKVKEEYIEIVYFFFCDTFISVLREET